MTDAIIKKINRHIMAGINREADVVYLLVQIRKILEREKIRSEYLTLDLYCDWILHPNINNTDKSGRILDKIETAILLLSSEDHKGAMDNINDAISFIKFHGDLRRFFKNNQLTFFDDESYTTLLALLIEVLKDIPLLARDNRFTFSFTSGKEVNSFDARIELSDQRVFRSPMISVATNWAAGMVAPSGAYEPADSEN